MGRSNLRIIEIDEEGKEIQVKSTEKIFFLNKTIQENFLRSEKSSLFLISC